MNNNTEYELKNKRVEEIKNIQNEIARKFDLEIKRLEDSPANRDNKGRLEALKTLQEKISKICNEAIESQKKETAPVPYGKTFLAHNIVDEIRDNLHLTTKIHTDSEKFIKNLLNFVTTIIFPLAAVKWLITGSFFYSTVGKTHETAEEAINIAKKFKPITPDL